MKSTSTQNATEGREFFDNPATNAELIENEETCVLSETWENKVDVGHPMQTKVKEWEFQTKNHNLSHPLKCKTVENIGYKWATDGCWSIEKWNLENSNE